MSKGLGLLAPTVGTWRPRIGAGAPLTPGLVLGVLVRVGRPVEVVAPDGVDGIAASVAPGGWVAYGDVLVERGLGLVAPTAEKRADAGEAPADVRVVRADSDGTVYLRADPTADPFAPPGSSVGAHQTLALIEVMKTFTPVRSPAAGRVARILVADGQAVSAGQPLVWVAPGP